MGFLDRFKRKQAVHLDDDEKGAAYEKGGRYSPNTKTARAGRGVDAKHRPARERYLDHYAPHPNIIRVIRFLLYGLTSLSALTTAGLAIAVVHYYNTVGPVIKPAWGSLIANIVFGIGTPGVLFGMMIVTPFLFKHGSVLGIINQTRTELLALFAVAAIWISAALAVACDLRGIENCLWDGYFHYPKPTDFEDVCRLINVHICLAYTTFGLAALQMVVMYAIAGYIMLFLDQEMLTEQTNYLGQRAYNARQAARSQRKSLIAGRNSTAAGGSVAGRRTLGGTSMTGTSVNGGALAPGVSNSRTVPHEALFGDSNSRTAPSNSRSNSGGSGLSSGGGGPMAGGRMASDPEEAHNSRVLRSEVDYAEDVDQPDEGSQYFGFERTHNRTKSRV